MRHSRRTLFAIALLIGLVQGRMLPAAVLPDDIHYTQCGESWSGDTMGAPGGCDEPICSMGCIITCGAMLLSWVAQGPGYPDPGELNVWLRDNGGYFGCLVMWGAIANYDGSGVGLEWVGKNPFDGWASLDAEVDAADRMPMVNVNAGAHWIVVYDRVGPSGDPASYLVMDPAHAFSPNRTLADYTSSGQGTGDISTFSGTFLFGEVAVVGGDVVSILPAALRNTPNPFNPQTTIAFDLPSEQAVSLCVYDVSGRLVGVLIDNVIAQAGRNEVVWRGRDLDGRIVSAGIYFYRLTAGPYTETKRMVLVK